MDCRGIRKQMSEYLDGELTQQELQDLERHLTDCRDCARELEQMRRTVDLVRQLPRVPAPSDLAAKTMAVVRHRSRQRRFPVWAIAVASSAAALMLLFVAAGGLVLMWGPVGSSPDRAGVVQEFQYSTGLALESRSQIEVADADAVPPAEPPPDSAQAIRTPSVAGASPVAFDQKVIRTADLRIWPDNFDEAYQKVQFLVDIEGGYVQQSSLSTYTRNDVQFRVADVVIRVPSDSYSRVITELSRLGEVRNRNEHGRDVTEEYYDIDARVRNLERQEARLRELMGRANTIDEIMRVEHELARVRGDIDILTGRLRYLDHRVSMSTIHVHLEEPSGDIKLPPGHSFWDRLVDTFLRSIRWLGHVGERALLFAVGALPVFIVLGAVWFGVRWLRTR